MCSVGFFCTACLFKDITTDNQLLTAQLVTQLTMPMLIPLALLYFRSFRTTQSQNPIGMFLLFLPFALFITELIAVSFIGLNNSVNLINRMIHGQSVERMLNSTDERILYICQIWVLPLMILIEYILLILTCIKVLIKTKRTRSKWINFFLKKRGSVYPIRQMAVNLLFYFTLFFSRCLIGIFTNNANIEFLFDLALSVSVVTTFLNGMFEAKERITLRDVLGAFKYNTQHYEDPGQLTTKYTIKHIPAPILSKEEAAMARIQAENPHADMIEEANKMRAINREKRNKENKLEKELSAGMLSLIDEKDKTNLQKRFEDIMINEKVFLMPGITSTYLTNRLNTNKYYLSRMISNAYGITFPEYLNILRIDYAKQYYLKHRDAQQSEVSKVCGYSSPPAFTNAFKKVTGMTPTHWLNQQGLKGRKKS